MAYVITFARRSTKRYLLAAFSDASFSPRRVTSQSWAPSCSKGPREHHPRVDCVATIRDELKVVDPPVRRFSGEELEDLSCRPLSNFQNMWTSKKSTTHFGGEKQASFPQRAQKCLEVASSCTEERAAASVVNLVLRHSGLERGRDVERHSPLSALALPHSG